jgi:hypothetical protein
MDFIAPMVTVNDSKGSEFVPDSSIEGKTLGNNDVSQADKLAIANEVGKIGPVL